jgi:hypothetical protein
MSKLKMEFYNAASGVQFEVQWRNEKEYRSVEAFLKQLLGQDTPSTLRPDQTPFYYFETVQQRDAFFAFQRELRGKKQSV